jgi:hypothetical protein
VASFNLVRHQRANEHIFLYAFDLIELNGDDCGAILPGIPESRRLGTLYRGCLNMFLRHAPHSIPASMRP